MGKISPNELVPGDHIYSYRNAYVYSHHGIYVGEWQVIHYTRTDESRCSFNVTGDCECGFDPNKHHGVVKSCLECFLSDRKLRRVEYGVTSKRRLLKRPGTYSRKNSDDAKTVLERAKKLLKENSFGKYNLVFNNCESFARYCMTQDVVSKQVVAAGVAVGGAAVGGAGVAGVAFGANNSVHENSMDRNNDEDRLTRTNSRLEKHKEIPGEDYGVNDTFNDYDDENSEEEDDG